MKKFTLLFFIIPLMLSAQKPKIIAHRGASGNSPENTLASIQKALDIGVDLIEIDIHLSKDGEVMVIHDATLDRTTDGSGNVVDFTLEELKKLDAGTWFDEKFKGEQIPTLREVLERCIGKTPVLIEVKKGAGYYSGIEAKSWEIVKEMKAEKWVEFQSFYDHSLEAMHSSGIDVPIHKLLVAYYPGFPIYFDHEICFGNYFKKKKVEVEGINPNINFVSSAFMAQINQEALSTYIWTVNEEKKMRKMISLGVSGIITNYPKELKQLLNE